MAQGIEFYRREGGGGSKGRRARQAVAAAIATGSAPSAITVAIVGATRRAIRAGCRHCERNSHAHAAQSRQNRNFLATIAMTDTAVAQRHPPPNSASLRDQTSAAVQTMRKQQRDAATQEHQHVNRYRRSARHIPPRLIPMKGRLCRAASNRNGESRAHLRARRSCARPPRFKLMLWTEGGRRSLSLTGRRAPAGLRPTSRCATGSIQSTRSRCRANLLDTLRGEAWSTHRHIRPARDRLRDSRPAPAASREGEIPETPLLAASIGSGEFSRANERLSETPSARAGRRDSVTQGNWLTSLTPANKREARIPVRQRAE